MRPASRLRAESVSFSIGRAGEPEHLVTANFGYDPRTSQLQEIAIVEAGKIGHGLQLLLSDLGLKLSRALQGRNPDTGAD